MDAELDRMVAQRARAIHSLAEALDSDFFRALAEPVRIEIVKALLLHGSSDIHSLASHLPQDRSVLSRHLQTLLRAGLVSCQKEGRRRIYALAPGAFVVRMEHMLQSVRGLIAICCPPEKR
jgi:DNA-binding transcriptional ArsR family regulator